MNEGSTFRRRTALLGDIVNSQAVYVGASPDESYSDTLNPGFSTFRSTISALNSGTGRTPVVYAGGKRWNAARVQCQNGGFEWNNHYSGRQRAVRLHSKLRFVRALFTLYTIHQRNCIARDERNFFTQIFSRPDADHSERRFQSDWRCSKWGFFEFAEFFSCGLENYLSRGFGQRR